ncbi:MAG: YicC/YloC family endoribonuclease [Acetobacteraceae bacterium]
MHAPLASMTGFARTEGTAGGLSWVWELRSVNGRGLDLRFRLPPGWDALEPAFREETAKSLKRGNVTANLTVKREIEARLSVDPAALEQALSLAMDLHQRIPGSPVPRAEALLSLPGVMRQASTDPAEERAAAMADVRTGFTAGLSGLVTARHQEGARLRTVIAALLAEITALRTQAATEAADQPAAQRARVMENLQALLREASNLPEERIAQEVALLAARSDVREELDRLSSHIQAAHALLDEGAAVGRRFDFLVQEFNREANTLCSKSASVELTATGLRLKAAIEQMREQVQNIE